MADFVRQPSLGGTEETAETGLSVDYPLDEVLSSRP